MSGQACASSSSLTLGQFVKFTYPDVLSKTHCVPPLHFKGVHYDRVCVPGTPALPVLVRKAPIGAQPGPSGPSTSLQSGVQSSSGQQTTEPSTTDSTTTTNSQQAPTTAASPSPEDGTNNQDSASQSSTLDCTQSPPTQPQPEDTPLSDYSLWPKDTHPKTTPAAVYESDAADDFSQQYLLYNLHTLAKHLGEVMFILSTVHFQNYLNRASGKQQFPRPKDLQKNIRGEFDFLVIHRHRGVLVGEMKSVGKQQAELKLSQADDDACVVKRVEKGVKQLVKGKSVVTHLVSDVVQGLPVVAALFLPFVSRSQLLRVLSANPALAQDVCSCLNVNTPQEAVDMTLCSDDLSDPNDYREVTPHVLSQLTSWWQRRMMSCTGQGLSDDQYMDIVGRFVGPATTVSVHCSARPRLTIEVRTEGEAVAELGMRLARLVLTPEQVDLLNRAPPRAYLTGPPGTGKSVMLILMGLVWLLKGWNVQVVSLWDNAKAACNLVYHQIKKTLQDSASDSGVPGATGQVTYHSFNFYADIHGNRASVKTVVDALTKAAQNQPPCVIIDEASFEPKAENLLKRLQKLYPNLHLWAANIKGNTRFKELPTERMTIPLRSAPRVVQELQKALDTGYYKGKVESYCMDGIPSAGDGLDPTVIHHQDPPHMGDRLIFCFQCGVEVAKALRDLGVGKSDRLVPNSPDSLQFRDVLILERDKTHPPYDNLKDPEGTILLPASDLVRGLREEGIPVRVVEDRQYVEDLEYKCRWERHHLKGCTVPQDKDVQWEKMSLETKKSWMHHFEKGCEVENQDTEERWKAHREKERKEWETRREDMATARHDEVIITTKQFVQGLERKVVVALLKSMAGLNTEDRIRCLSRCTTHLVFVHSGDSTEDTPDASGDSAKQTSKAEAASTKSPKAKESKKPSKAKAVSET